MTQTNCPSCKRKGTYSKKHEQCAACGLGYEIATVPDDVKPEGLHDGRVTPVTEEPVTKRVTVTPNVTSGVTGIVTAFTPAVQPPMPGEECPTCGRRSPMTAGQRKRKSRKEG